MTKSPHEVFDLAGRIFGMGVLIAARPDVEVYELPVKKVDDMAYRIYSLGYLDALNHANGGRQTDHILPHCSGVQLPITGPWDAGASPRPAAATTSARLVLWCTRRLAHLTTTNLAQLSEDQINQVNLKLVEQLDSIAVGEEV